MTFKKAFLLMSLLTLTTPVFARGGGHGGGGHSSGHSSSHASSHGTSSHEGNGHASQSEGHYNHHTSRFDGSYHGYYEGETFHSSSLKATSKSQIKNKTTQTSGLETQRLSQTSYDMNHPPSGVSSQEFLNSIFLNRLYRSVYLHSYDSNDDCTKEHMENCTKDENPKTGNW